MLYSYTTLLISALISLNPKAIIIFYSPLFSTKEVENDYKGGSSYPYGFIFFHSLLEGLYSKISFEGELFFNRPPIKKILSLLLTNACLLLGPGFYSPFGKIYYQINVGSSSFKQIE